MERHERIAEAIAASGKKKGEIAAECGVANSAVTQWINGDSKSLKPENLYALAKATGYRAEWLAIGMGPKQELVTQEVGGTYESHRTPHEDDYALIPQYAIKGDCGAGYLNGHVEVKGGLAFKRDWLAKMRVKADNLYVIYADGDSMEPYIFEGDVVLFDGSDTEPRDRQVYAIRRPDGGISIKRIIQQLSGAWMIRSDNPDKTAYPDEPVSQATLHEMPILGRVIWRGGGIG
ncbi:Phage repressor protein C, contains Cro/C1-type HTH and peptisase s24 domains [Pseudomonas linyingensis]|uniref:Phage repressor protein C, contains Cro/C1-type HTH and peptisase s24 domains n=1 Tax=Pseudomonas linyingensis TaxID=915471 RepID=A0A1H6Z2V8_9PSED|nr:LexA family transcriptional regulator [Pseudomonas linyingensis]SEJ46334.1 Phage repressor protein C, contains Cro/C1-type HTH and peptisase s24 domains [Pseudomonas linyingensis]